MLAFQIYRDDRLTMEVNWFGFGALTVYEEGRGQRVAHPMQKRFLTGINDELLAQGIKLNPSDPRCRHIYGMFAQALVEAPPSGLMWRVAFEQGPRHWARAALQEFADS